MLHIAQTAAHPMGLPSFLNSFRTLSTSSCSFIPAPSTANELLTNREKGYHDVHSYCLAQDNTTHRFLAAPNPPGRITASNFEAFSFANGEILPLAIRADSSSTFLHGGRSGSHNCGADSQLCPVAAYRCSVWLGSPTR